MKTSFTSAAGFFRPRLLVALTLCLMGVSLGAFSLTRTSKRAGQPSASAERLERDMPVPGGEGDSDGESLIRLESEWSNRLTYPTGRFDPAWVRRAAAHDTRILRRVPLGQRSARGRGNSPLALDPNHFTALGPAPEHMTGCTGCYDYGTTQGRVNAIAVDPTTTTNGSVVAYIAGNGGGVWKTTNCCGSLTSWNSLMDDPLISTTAIDTITIDPNDHNTIYAGTGDLNYGSFSMGSQGILKSSDGGAHWTLLGADVFGAALPQPAGQFPQYQSVGKVRVDPNNSNNVVAGTKTGLYFSYDGGSNWTGPCVTNGFSTQRQDITGLELSNLGAGVTRILAAVGVRGFATTVQYNLDQNGANGIYKGTMPASGCPSDFTLVTRNDNGFIFGTAVGGSPYSTGANMNAGTGTPYANTSTGNQIGRIDMAVAPGNPNYIYAQVGSIAANSSSGCGGSAGCQLGVWASNDGGNSWSFMTGSAGGSLASCSGSAGSGDYSQNWYDQGVAVDPNNPDRVFIDTFDSWLASRTGSSFYNLTCGYNGSSLANHVVHVDHHALAFVPGSSSVLLEGSDGGIFSTSNADVAVIGSVRPTWVNMDNGMNTIEFYSGDISGNFATSGSPAAVGGAQDNGPSSVQFVGSPTGPVQWQMGLGGDGFSGQIDPVGTGASLRFWEGNNSGGLSRCIAGCTLPGASWSSKRGSWSSDLQSFILPINLFHGGIPGGDDCEVAGTNTGCGHLIAGTTRVWETITGANASTTTWYITNNPPGSSGGPNLCKGTLGNRSFINQVKYSPKYQSVAIVGTNDGNVQIGFNLGTGTASQANWVNVTGNNTVLPNRPVLGISLDPSVAAANMPVGYAAVGGFNANTPTTPGHVFQVTCGDTCGSFSWLDKTGNLPDIPVDSIVNNPNYPQQVFAGTDFGLYYTDDITVASPVWYRFQNGLPNAMIWDMAIDRGSTTLSVWTRSRGAYVWPLPSGPVPVPVPTAIVSRKTHGAAGMFDIDLKNAPGIECRSGGVTGDYTVVVTFGAPVTVIGNGTVKAQVTSGPGDVGTSGVGNGNGITVSGAEVTVPLTNIDGAERLAFTIYGVNDGTNAGNVVIPMNVLVGDANANGQVSSSDVSLVKAVSGQTTNGSNFREDVIASGSINSGDISFVKSRLGTGLP